jgi:cell division protein FtsW (lipid II flippase)
LGSFPSVALAPVPATAVGLAVAASHGIGWTAYLPNLAALGLGTLTVLVARRARVEVLERWAPTLAALAIAGTLLGREVDGVARWVSMGGLQVHASGALAPWLLMGLAARSSTARRLSLAATCAAQLVHVAQPDAGQATALAAGGLVLLTYSSSVPRLERLGAGLALAGATAIAWARPDPLAPVDHVERVLFLAFDRGPAWTVAVAAAMLPLFAGLAGRDARTREPISLAVLGYFAASFAVTFFGHFPVPVYGAGFALPLGWFALLAVRERGRRVTVERKDTDTTVGASRP